MHDPEFEKHVQEKMEELQFNPSGEVWTKVEQEIKKEKRRRPLLWIFLLSGVLLGAGYWLVATGNKQLETKNEKLKTKNEAGDDNTKITERENSNSQKENLKEGDEPKLNDATINNYSIAKNNITIKPKTSSAQKKSLDDKRSVLLLNKNEKGKSEKLKVKKEEADGIVDDAVVGNNNISSEKKNDVGIDATKQNENIAADSQINKTSVTDEIKTKKEDLSNKKNKTTDSPINKTAVAKNINSKKSRSLRLGFTGGTGVSDIETFSSSNYPAILNSTGGNVSGYNGNNGKPSSIQTGISFYAGAFLERSFSKKVSLSAGLNYHYYSTRIRTGTKVDSVIFVPSNFYLNSSSTAQAGAYRGGTINNYNEHYHFIELPLLLELRINSNNKIPITWKGGFSFSYLINTNALQFDPASGVYFKDNSLFNKTQVNTITGLMIGFYQRKNLIQVGPEIQYGVTKILHGYITNNQHMLYYGLGISIVPQKK
jgi:Outer membrane protein beta-barrel domain